MIAPEAERVGVIHIATGPYKRFTERFVSSAVGGFETRRRKIIYIVTDAPEAFADLGKRYDCDIRLHQIDHEPWPAPTLNRFHYINALKRQFAEDGLAYLFFVNANAVFISAEPVDELRNAGKRLGFVQHPAFIDKAGKAPFERRLSSTACLPRRESDAVYVQGFFYGGAVDAFLELSQDLQANIDADRARGIVAVWHDESHLNCALATRWKDEAHIFDAGYAFPEGWRLSAPCRIFSRDKSKLMDVTFKSAGARQAPRRQIWSRLVQNVFSAKPSPSS